MIKARELLLLTENVFKSFSFFEYELFSIIQVDDCTIFERERITNDCFDNFI